MSLVIIRNVYHFDCRGCCGRKQVASGNPNQMYCEQTLCQNLKRERTLAHKRDLRSKRNI